MKEIIDDIIVVKIGTSTLSQRMEDGSERLDPLAFDHITGQIRELQDMGRAVVAVSSAAISGGMEATGTRIRPEASSDMPELQRLASLGWLPVLNQWDRSMRQRRVGGLLLTRQELNIDSPERGEALRTIHTLLSHGDLPVVNENDSITHEEIAFGDNDRLAATLAAQMAGHSVLFGKNIKLVLLTDVNGVLDFNKEHSPLVKEVDDITKYEHLAQGAGSLSGQGGMKTKFEAAKIATKAGVPMWIVKGRSHDSIRRALNGEIGTHFRVKL